MRVTPPSPTATKTVEKVLPANPSTEKKASLSVQKPIASPVPDPFDPVSLRISPGNSGIAVRKIITAIPCQKAPKQTFIRSRSGGEWQLDALILEDKENGNDYYIVAPALHEHLVQEGFPVRLTLAVTRNGNPFLWLLKLPGADGRSNRWNDSALVAAQLAETKWVRVVSNMGAGCYEVHAAESLNVEPQWPDLSFKEILRLCFRDRFIDSLDHPFLKRLRGEM